MVLVLEIAAFVLFLIAGVFPPREPVNPYRVHLVAAGLACWVLTTFVERL